MGSESLDAINRYKKNVTEITSALSQNLEDDLLEFDSKLQSLKNVYLDNENIMSELNNQEKDISKQLEIQMQWLNEFKSNCDYNEAFLKKKQDEMKNILIKKKEAEKKLIEESSKYKKPIDEIDLKYHMENKYNDKKDTILTYKLLFNSTFIYDGLKPRDVIFKSPIRHLNLKNLSKAEIREKLWQLRLES